LESAWTKRPYPECFRSRWTGKEPEKTAPIPDLEAGKPSGEEKKSRYNVKRIALGVAAAFAAALFLWKSGIVELGMRTISGLFPPSLPSPPDINDDPDPASTTPECPNPADPIDSTPGSTSSSPLLSEQITLFTSYTADKPERLQMSRKVMASQRSYCKKHGHKYQVFEKNLADLSWFDSSLPYWSKIAGINRMLSKGSGTGRPCWIVWLDDDAIVLNTDLAMDQFILAHGGKDPNVHVIVTQDVPHAPTKVNTGVLIVRNSDTSRKFFQELWDMRHATAKSSRYAYSSCPAQRCLHEQEAMHDLLEAHPEYLDFVRILPQTGGDGIGINTFERFNHYDDNREDPYNPGNPMYLNYNGDPQSSQCKSGDFICQCTGLATKGRRQPGDSPSNLRMECIDSLLSRVK